MSPMGYPLSNRAGCMGKVVQMQSIGGNVGPAAETYPALKAAEEELSRPGRSRVASVPSGRRVKVG